MVGFGVSEAEVPTAVCKSRQAGSDEGFCGHVRNNYQYRCLERALKAMLLKNESRQHDERVHLFDRRRH